MKNFLNQYKTFIIITVIVIALAVWQYYRGKKAGAVVIPDAPYIKGAAAIPEGFNPNILADKLHSAMSGLFTLSSTKDAVWLELFNLSTDDMVIAVYNAFNKKYGSEGKGSLTKWIDDEYYYDFASGVKTKTLERLKNLRLN